jgi:hypothetical protein
MRKKNKEKLTLERRLPVAFFGTVNLGIRKKNPIYLCGRGRFVMLKRNELK